MIFWYLQNKVEPDWNTLNKTIGIADKEDLKKKIIVLIDEKVTVQKLSFDLSNFFRPDVRGDLLQELQKN